VRILQILNGTWGGLKVSAIGLLIGALAVAAYSFCLLTNGLFGFLFLLAWAILIAGFVIHVRHMARGNGKKPREKMCAKSNQSWEP